MIVTRLTLMRNPRREYCPQTSDDEVREAVHETVDYAYVPRLLRLLSQPKAGE